MLKQFANIFSGLVYEIVCSRGGVIFHEEAQFRYLLQDAKRTRHDYEYIFNSSGSFEISSILVFCYVSEYSEFGWIQSYHCNPDMGPS